MVLSVSCVLAKERAKAVSVSFGREKVRPAALCYRESAKKFALRAQNTPNLVFLCLLGELFRGKAGVGAVLGEFFRACWRSDRVYGSSGALHTTSSGGFALHEAP